MVLPLSRTNAEAHLYMDLRPCACGETRFGRDSAVVALDDGDLASRYTGTCARCGQPREFVFRLPAEIRMPEAANGYSYGGDEPSQLIDPGEWLWVADAYAGQVPAEPPTDPEQRRRSAALLHRAAAAVAEALKFIPADADRVPPASITSERGQEILRRQPERFRRNRLDVLRRTYAEMADRLA